MSRCCDALAVSGYVALMLCRSVQLWDPSSAMSGGQGVEGSVVKEEEEEGDEESVEKGGEESVEEGGEESVEEPVEPVEEAELAGSGFLIAAAQVANGVQVRHLWLVIISLGFRTWGGYECAGAGETMSLRRGRGRGGKG